MKTDAHLWYYLAELFSEWEIFYTKFVGKIKTHILWSITFSWKSCRLCDNAEKYGRAGDVASSYVCWIAQATNIHSEYVIFVSFPREEWLRECASMLRSYVHFNINLTSTPPYVFQVVCCNHIFPPKSYSSIPVACPAHLTLLGVKTLIMPVKNGIRHETLRYAGFSSFLLLPSS